MGIFSKKVKKSDDQPSLKKAKSKIFLEYEDEESTNPKIKLYNEMVRHAYGYNTDFFSTCGIGDFQEIRKIFQYVIDDYPEIFWVSGYQISGDTMALSYRCVTEDGQVDVKDIERKRAELRKSAKHFTRGITKKTKPYDALITIYRRLILELDYDGVGLKTEQNSSIKDVNTDDKLRSLYSALVTKKVVCAGYAVALQYLLQSVGISCGVVCSEWKNNSGHAFNALKIGKYVYYVDATWGDMSNTLTGKKDAGEIHYDYCCVPYKELLLTSAETRYNHTPNSEYYPNLEEFTDTNHEYFRFRKAYLVRYDENLIAKVLANTAKTYDPKEMGNFSVGFRCHDVQLMNYVIKQLQANLYKIIGKAKAQCKNKRQANKLFASSPKITWNNNTAVFYVCFN